MAGIDSFVNIILKNKTEEKVINHPILRDETDEIESITIFIKGFRKLLFNPKTISEAIRILNDLIAHLDKLEKEEKEKEKEKEEKDKDKQTKGQKEEPKKPVAPNNAGNSNKPKKGKGR